MLASVSPTTAPRQCPTCMGPVGLADTYSTLIFWPRTERLAAEIGAFADHCDQQPAPEIVGQLQVDEARTCDVGTRDVGVLDQFGDDPFSQRTRVLPGRLCQHHRRVAGQIAMGCVARRFDRDARRVDQRAGIIFQVKCLDNFGDPTLKSAKIFMVNLRSLVKAATGSSNASQVCRSLSQIRRMVKQALMFLDGIVSVIPARKSAALRALMRS